jgi:tetratricopeptide (TPR) repeat protein
MKTLGLKILPALLLGILLYLPVSAQEGNTAGSASGEWMKNDDCLRNLSLYYEFYKHKNYKDALDPWRQAFRICPEAKESLHAYGIVMYKDILDKEKDEARIAAYSDTLMMIYDTRIKYFPASKGDVLGRKGVDLLRYRRNSGIEYIFEGYNILKESVDIEKDNSSAVVLTTLISASITLLNDKKLDNEAVINDYVKVSEIIDRTLAKKPDSRMEKAKEVNDANIKESKVLTCESITKIFKPKFEAQKQDKDFLLLVTGFMEEGQCEGEDFYSEATEQLYALEPSSEAAYKLGKLFQKKGEYTKAKSYFLEAIGSASDPNIKANYYYELGILCYNYLKQPQDAVNYAQEALKNNPNLGEPYILIGISYVEGNSSLGDEFERRTAYWLAVDMFNKAKNTDPAIAPRASELAVQYSSYFPTKEDLFFRSIAEGSAYTVGGWINRTTTARAKN